MEYFSVVTELVKWAARQLSPAAALGRARHLRVWFRLLPHRVRWSALVYREAAVGIGVFDGHRIAYRIGSVDTAVLDHSFGKDIFLAAIPEYVLPVDGVILDVGAHIGTFSLLTAGKARAGRVYAIEASRETFDLLKVNVGLSGCSNVVADHLALADRDGTAHLYHDPTGNYGHSITKDMGGSSELVVCATLSQYLAGGQVESVDLAKFNCEGAEFGILLSTPAVILRRIAKMIILYHCDLVQDRPETLLAHLHSSGFSTRLLNQTADRGWIIATREPKPHDNSSKA